jgi:ketosteroid isomerase-like protein
MSRENVELVRAALEAWNAGDMDALRETTPPTSAPGHRRIGQGGDAGWNAVLRQLEELRETWDADIAEPATDFIETNDGLVVKLIWRGTGRGAEVTALLSVRTGRVSEIEFFWDHIEALEATGLQE